jgi:hypothetical protein
MGEEFLEMVEMGGLEPPDPLHAKQKKRQTSRPQETEEITDFALEIRAFRAIAAFTGVRAFRRFPPQLS